MVVLGCDVGGTFTDCVLHDPSRGLLLSHKVPTTPQDPSEGAVRGLVEVLGSGARRPADVARVVHGSTVATNALLTRRGPRVALVTNAGFEDVIEIGRQDRPSLYDFEAERPPPLVPRGSRFGVRGRLDPHGAEVEPFAAEDLGAVVGAIARHDAVAIVLLHAYANPEPERRAEAVLRRLAPRLAIATSSGTAPEFREYERTSTTVANAFLLPVVDRYLAALEQRLSRAGIVAPLHVLESAGGVLDAAAARAKPVSTVVSGPAGGAAACGLLAQATGERRLLGFDMGGTSTDLCVVLDGQARETREAEVGGMPLRVPMLDVVTIGAGGGSVARMDAAGLLRVGPESAEAHPGPACYGRGGTAPTVTDAHVVLGDVDSLLAGTFPLDAKAAERALAPLASAMGTGIPEAARAVLDVTEAGMLAAARLATSSRGHDPRTFTLCAFGGAGPLHAVALARGLGIRRVLVPVAPGALSALGMVGAELRRDAVRTWLASPEGAAPALEALGRNVAEDLARAGASDGAVGLRFACDARYRGQSFEITVPLATPPAVAGVAPAFHAAHEAAFGYAAPEAAIEIVALRARAFARRAPFLLPTPSPGEAEPRPEAIRGRRSLLLPGGRVDAPVWDRTRLSPGNAIEGPAIVEDPGSTLLLPAGASARVDPHGNLVVEVGA